METRSCFSRTLFMALSQAVQRPGVVQAYTPILVTALLVGITYVPELRARQSATGAAAGRCLTEVPVSRLRNRTDVKKTASLRSSSQPSHDGMVWIEGGEFWMGSDDPNFPDAKPVHKVYVDGFWMDKTTVTNAQFAAFVKATGYVTVAERPVDPAQYPGAPPEMLMPGAPVFVAPSGPVPLDSLLNWWRWQPGASWRHPRGPGSDIQGAGNQPIVQVAYEDAIAYAQWAGKRLPTEAEWEFAARGGLDRKTFVWGEETNPGGKHMANTYQGHFPDKNTAEDGFTGLAPVCSFPVNAYGLCDMSGNVWNWVSDWYRADYYQTLAAQGGVARNPKGPEQSFDPFEPGIAKRVQKGGSFLCSDQYCGRYRPGGRGKGDPSTGASHVGFRLVAS
jgi:formylglycine-generating enzyme required for sulfatase activity